MYNLCVKDLEFLGDTLNIIKKFPDLGRREEGFQLDKVQQGLDPDDWKPMKTVGVGVREIRIHEEGEYRVIYIAKFRDAVYVLHAFSKKTKKTVQHDLDKAKDVLKKLCSNKRCSHD